MAVMLVSMNKGTATMLLSSTNPPGIRVYSYANVFLYFSWKACALITWVKKLHREFKLPLNPKMFFAQIIFCYCPDYFGENVSRSDRTALMAHPHCGIVAFHGLFLWSDSTRVSLSTRMAKKGERAWFRGWVNSFQSLIVWCHFRLRWLWFPLAQNPQKPWTHRFYAISMWLLQSFSPWNHPLECYTECLQLVPHFVSSC